MFVTDNKKKTKLHQPNLFDLTEEYEDSVSTIFHTQQVGIPRIGITVLDRIHQCMLLFAAGRGQALKRFMTEQGGVGHDQRFWKLAQVLSALYLLVVTEKRWVDGVLARKKGLGL